jgi:phosphatidylserine decarboxylase
MRPVAFPDDHIVIVHACESTPYNVAYGVKARDKFGNKGQPYSVSDMLAHDELADQFVGGTVYQAHLHSLAYHRWHSPVTGRIVKAYLVEGTYFSESLFEAIDDPQGDPDLDGEYNSQVYLAAIATLRSSSLEQLFQLLV